ncbi:ATP synthase F1 subunit delta [Mycoplasma sp. OR1901]|uniref:ATP synthase F1 subunit delta n=1 Tax=Mycoplasma sp. OR1901 TaxID=2742195 RepID=UPI0015834233|nr:ATP synthase F1 subunit delta [Mycoplasma sp. OR1901]QKT05513.1 ATP synthase F1 subunit delta [Mycoplasma sp. OR1901]
MYEKRHISAYAVAIFDLAKEEDKFEILQTEFETLKEFADNKEFIDYLANYDISETHKFETIDIAFKDFHWITTNFIKVIVSRKVVSYLKKIIIEYLKLSNHELRIRFVDVISAFPIDEKQLLDIKNKLQENTRRKVRITHHVDPNLISGFKIVSRTEVLENNIKKELDKLKNDILINKKEV